MTSPTHIPSVISDTPRLPGRPRLTEESDALDAAMRCFWARGYEGSSIGWLISQMHLPRASLYQRFGDKRGLFLACIDHYARTRTDVVIANLSARGNAAGEISAFYNDMIDLVTGSPKNRGCLVACVLADAAGSDAQFRKLLRHKLDVLEDRIYACLKNDTDDASEERLRRTAAMLAATARGLSLAARADTAADTLRATAQITVELACANIRNT